MNTLYIVLIGFAITYELWIYYLAVMSLKRAKNAGLLTSNVRKLATPILVVGLALDVVVNAFVMTILFLQLPSELTVTARLKRYIKMGAGWRFKVAQKFIVLLDPYDPSGRHIT